MWILNTAPLISTSTEVPITPEAEPPVEEATASDKEKNKKERESAATKVVRAVEDRGGVELFHDGRDTYAAVENDGHREVMSIGSRALRLFLIKLYYSLTAKIPHAQAIAAARGLLEAKALFDGPDHKVYVRVAPGQGDDIYLDLGDDSYYAVHITASGWQVVSRPPVYFRRPDSMRALPVPTRGGKLDDLRKFLNLASGEAFVLLKGFLLAALRPCGPYPIGHIAGQQGTAKTTTCRIIRALVDPCKAEVRSAPNEEDDLLIAANNGHLIVLDNLSRLEPWLSDAMCRVATGGGLSKRQLYTDQDEIVIEVCRPQLINAIEDLAFRGDFAERALTITLEPITERCRRDEDEFWRSFESKRPAILGGLLDAECLAIRQLPTTRLDRKPRMAGFALLCTAAEPILAPPGEFMNAYSGNIRLAQEVILEASLIAPYIIKLVDESDGVWTGTTKQLLNRLKEMSGESGNESEQRDRGWPRTPHKLAGILRRLAVALLSSGIRYVEPDRHTKSRTLRLENIGRTTAPKAPTGKPLNEKDLFGPDVGADVGADGADLVPKLFQAKGTTQPIENSSAYTNGADGAFIPPIFSKKPSTEGHVSYGMPRCPKCQSFALCPQADGNYECMTCGLVGIMQDTVRNGDSGRWEPEKVAVATQPENRSASDAEDEDDSPWEPVQ